MKISKIRENKRKFIYKNDIIYNEFIYEKLE